MRPPPDLHLLQTQCCSATGLQHAGQEPRSFGSAALLYLWSPGYKMLRLDTNTIIYNYFINMSMTLKTAPTECTSM